ncbi:MAG: hypothetical protein HY301_02930 [Verrucomicrobia bacterium]|nr:hypothetical protein [Verrucomicrobiota bacterium]
MKPTLKFSHRSIPQRFTVGALAVLAFAPLAHAHPGHSLTEATPLHLLTSPDHLAMLALLGGGLCVAAQFVRRPLPRRAMQFAGALGVIAAAALFAARA